jgi:hypothetical protein
MPMNQSTDSTSTRPMAGMLGTACKRHHAAEHAEHEDRELRNFGQLSSHSRARWSLCKRRRGAGVCAAESLPMVVSVTATRTKVRRLPQSDAVRFPRISFHSSTLLHTLAGWSRTVGRVHDPVQGRGTGRGNL